MNKLLDKPAKTILRVTIITLIANIILTILKVIFGLVFSNLPVMSDAIHSLTDVVAPLLVIASVFISSPKPDKTHNYGHEKTESLIVLFFSIALISISGFFIWQGISGLINPQNTKISFYLFAVTILSILSKEAMFWYTRYYAKKINSQILKADAWHHRIDSLSSVAVLIGLCVSIFVNNNIAENIVVILIALLIFKVSIDIMRPAINQLLDKSANDKTIDKIKEIALQVDGVFSIDKLKTRLFGNSIYVDIEIAVDKNLTVEQAHVIAQSVHDELENAEQLHIKHCNTHVNPSENKKLTDILT